MTTDFETHPVGTGKRLAELEGLAFARRGAEYTRPVTDEDADAARRAFHADGCSPWGDATPSIRVRWRRVAEAVRDRLSGREMVAEPTYEEGYATGRRDEAQAAAALTRTILGEAPRPTHTLPTVVEVIEVLRAHEDCFCTDTALALLDLFATKVPYRFPDSWERGHEAKYWSETGLTPYGLTLDADRAPGVLNWLGVNYYTPDSPCLPAPDPTPAIAPRDVRVGDVLAITYTVTVTGQDDEYNISTDDSDRRQHNLHAYNASARLLDRPDPDAELIEGVATAIAASLSGTDYSWRSEARAALAKIRETHTIEPRPTTGDLRA